MEWVARIEIIGVNPFVFVPEVLLEAVFREAGKNKGAIPVCGTLNGRHYTQTLVRFQGNWRLYINTAMLKNSPKRVGEDIKLTIGYDPRVRTVTMHPKLQDALTKNPEAAKVLDGLAPSRRKEIVRYIASLKTEAAVEKNVARAIGFLLGQERFVGRDKP